MKFENFKDQCTTTFFLCLKHKLKSYIELKRTETIQVSNDLIQYKRGESSGNGHNKSGVKGKELEKYVSGSFFVGHFTLGLLCELKKKNNVHLVKVHQT